MHIRCWDPAPRAAETLNAAVRNSACANAMPAWVRAPFFPRVPPPMLPFPLPDRPLHRHLLPLFPLSLPLPPLLPARASARSPAIPTTRRHGSMTPTTYLPRDAISFRYRILAIGSWSALRHVFRMPCAERSSAAPASAWEDNSCAVAPPPPAWTMHAYGPRDTNSARKHVGTSAAPIACSALPTSGLPASASVNASAHRTPPLAWNPLRRSLPLSPPFPAAPLALASAAWTAGAP